MTDTVTTTYPAMDPEVKAKWVEALRSGQFKQGDGYLKTRDGCNCCLGVLAEIQGIASEPSKDELNNGSYSYKFQHPNDSYDFQTYADVHETPVGFCGIGIIVRNKLMNMNDGGGDEAKHTFPEIADFIEKNL